MILGLFINSQVKEYDSLPNAFNAGAQYVIDTSVESIKEQFYDYGYSLKIYNADHKACHLQIGNWKTFDSTIKYKIGKYPYNFDIKVVDPTGEVSKIEIKSQRILEIIKEVYNQLQILSEFNTWKEFQLMKEINLLRKELESFKESS